MSVPVVAKVRSHQGTLIRVVLLVLIVALAALVTRNVVGSRANGATGKVPQNAAMESSLGIRISRVAVVGDGGLITVSYVVLEAEKALKFQTDAAHPPILTSESRKGGTQRVSLMRQGHSLRTGQTYYLVYQNTKGALRAGEKVTITKGDLALAHVPVL